METDRTSTALSRIKAALARIEAAAQARRAADQGADLARLQGQHDRLRAAVQDSLEQLDLLIEGAQA